MQDLLDEFRALKPDLNKFNGNPAPALAERLIIFINRLTPLANLFDDNFKTEIKRFINAYESARQNEKGGADIFKLVKPTDELITKTLQKKLG